MRSLLGVARVDHVRERHDLRTQLLDPLVLSSHGGYRMLTLGVLLEGLLVGLGQGWHLDGRKRLAGARGRALSRRKTGKCGQRRQGGLGHLALLLGHVERGDGLEDAKQPQHLVGGLVRRGAHEVLEAVNALGGLVAQHADHADHGPAARVPERVLGPQRRIGLVAADLSHDLVERSCQQRICNAAVNHLELWVDAQLDGVSMEDARAHAMNRRDPCAVDAQGLLAQMGVVLPRRAQGLTHALLDLEGSRVGKGDHQRLVDGGEVTAAVCGTALRKCMDEARREREGLARAGPCRDEQGLVETLHHAALALVEP